MWRVIPTTEKGPSAAPRPLEIVRPRIPTVKGHRAILASVNSIEMGVAEAEASPVKGIEVFKKLVV